MEAITKQSECKLDGPIIHLNLCATRCIHRTVKPESAEPSVIVKKPNCSNGENKIKCPWCRSVEHSGGKKSGPFSQHRRQDAIVLASQTEPRGGVVRETADTVVKEYKELEGEREKWRKNRRLTSNYQVSLKSVSKDPKADLKQWGRGDLQRQYNNLSNTEVLYFHVHVFRPCRCHASNQ